MHIESLHQISLTMGTIGPMKAVLQVKLHSQKQIQSELVTDMVMLSTVHTEILGYKSPQTVNREYTHKKDQGRH